MYTESVSLPKTFAAWQGKSDVAVIEDTLETELQRRASEILDGYNSDDERAEVLELKIEEDRLTARFAIYFQEVIPSGCADAPHRKPCRLERVLHLDSDMDQAVFQEDESNPDEWDLWDRNSAKDGY